VVRGANAPDALLWARAPSGYPEAWSGGRVPDRMAVAVYLVIFVVIFVVVVAGVAAGVGGRE
jgi:hypothetical protein